MVDKESKFLSKKYKKAQKKKNPNRKLKRNFLIVVLIFLGFFSSRPLALLTQKSSFGDLSKISAEVTKTGDISVKYVQGTFYKEADLVEIDLLVDVPANKLDFTLNPQVYTLKKKQVTGAKVEKINANYYVIFVPKSNVSSFQYYIAVPEKGNKADVINVGNLTYGFTISSHNTTQKAKFTAKKQTEYIKESHQLLSEKYQKQLTEIDKQMAASNKAIKSLLSKSQQLLSNVDGLTEDEKKQVSSQIASNNATITSLKSNISDLEESKTPIQDKIDVLTK